MGGRWQDAFTQVRDEFVVVFRTAAGRPVFVRVGTGGQLPYVWVQAHFRRAHRNSTDLFPELKDRPVTAVRLPGGDRTLVVDLAEEWQVAFKMHGTQSNVLVLQGGAVRAAFRQHRAGDWGFQPPTGPAPWPTAPMAVEAAVAGAKSVAEFRKTFLFWDQPLHRRWQALGGNPAAGVQVLTEAQQPPYWVGEEDGGLFFSVVEPPSGAEGFSTIREALDNYLGRTLARTAAAERRKAIALALAQQRKHWARRLEAVQAGRENLATQRDPEEIGHLLLAQVHAVPAKAETAVLDDYYRGGTCTVKLDPDLSPQANAERYYQKAKDQKARAHYLDELETQAQARLTEVESWAAAFAEARRPKELERFLRTHPQLLERPKDHAQATEALPYRRFERRGYAIWVGKGASDNDRLTFGHARKHDLWLHAKDVPGSHVIIRKTRDETVPLDVLEYAASLAAYYSKARSNTLVPVAYTPRKYLRKNKRLAAGQVIVEREEVILVEPQAPDEA